MGDCCSPGGGLETNHIFAFSTTCSLSFQIYLVQFLARPICICALFSHIMAYMQIWGVSLPSASKAATSICKNSYQFGVFSLFSFIEIRIYTHDGFFIQKDLQQQRRGVVFTQPKTSSSRRAPKLVSSRLHSVTTEVGGG